MFFKYRRNDKFRMVLVNFKKCAEGVQKYLAPFLEKIFRMLENDCSDSE